MARKSLYHCDRTCTFRETLNSFSDIARNGGTPANLTLSNGIGTFNGTTSSISYPIHTRYNTTPLTVITKVNTNQADAAKQVYNCYNSGTVNGFSLGQSSTGSGTWRFYIYNGTSDDARSDAVPTTGSWLSLAGSRLLTTHYIYINGILQAIAGGMAGALMPNINAYIGSLGAANYFDGQISEVNFFNRFLRGYELLNYNNNCLYKNVNLSNNILFDFSTINRYNIDNKGHALVNTAITNPKDGTFYTSRFDGSTSTVSIGGAIAAETAFTSATSFSLEVWVKPFSAGIADGNVISRNSNSNGNWGIRIQSTGRVLFLCQDTTGNSCNVTSTTSITNRQWHHIVAVYDASTKTGYVYTDGQPNGSTNTPALSGNLYNVNTVNLGRRDQGAGDIYYKGEITGVRIYNKALSTSEISRLYNSTKRYYE